jgi:phosphohistidine phosphatase
MGEFMANLGIIPSVVFCSAARRARETWELVSQAMGAEVPVEFREDLYHTYSGSLMAMVQGLGDEAESVLLVGHNPTFEELAHSLSGAGDEGSLITMAKKYPTGALAIIEFPVQHWVEVREGAGYLRSFVRPKDLK